MIGCSSDTETASTEPAASSTTTAGAATTVVPSTEATTPTTAVPSTDVTTGEKITLTLALFIPESHARWQNMLAPWVEEIEARTNGQVDIVPYFAESLAKMAELYPAVVSGVADMAEGGFAAGQFPLTEQIGGFSSGSAITSNPTKILWELYKSTPAMQEEFSETHLLMLESSLPARLGSTKPIKSLQDMKGLKVGIQGLGLQAKKLMSIGASVETIPPSDSFMAMQRGVVDAFMADYTLMVARKYGEVLKNITAMNISGSQFYITMNKQKWESLPPNVQEVFNSLSGDNVVDRFGKVWLENEKALKDKYLKDMGGAVWELSAEDKATLDKAFADTLEGVLADMEGKGYPIRDLYKRFLELEAKYATEWF
jgi:TRAP-type transport system periplasmic protein